MARDQQGLALAGAPESARAFDLAIPTQVFGSYGFTPYPNDTYVGTAIVSVDQLTDGSSIAMESVASKFARGLNLDRLAFPYTNINEMQKRFGA